MVSEVDQNSQSLRAAIAWALQLADAQGNTLVAAVLEDALRHADPDFDPDRDA